MKSYSLYVFAQVDNIVFVFVAASNIISAAIGKNSSAFAPHKVVTMFAFDDVFALIALATIAK
jgi:hypothetical protein